MSLSVAFTREAENQLTGLFHYIAARGSPAVASQYADAIISFCDDLAAFPTRGRLRDDIRPGLRTIGFRRRVVIAYAVISDVLVIIGVFYGGRDYEGAFKDPPVDSG